MSNGSVLRSFVMLATLLTPLTSALAENMQWVTTDRTNRHTCPSTKCGVAGYLMFREGAEILETKNGWSRITKAYSASCEGGKSEYVKEGNSSCTSKNGIQNGKFAEWVQNKDLSPNRPEDPGKGATGDHSLVSSSDDYRIYKNQFAKAARELINDGTCTEADFKEMGGWMASSNRGKGVYFTYCGGMTLSNKIYLDAISGNVSR
ncbi:hypothetical protein [Pseudomonas lini]|uniref:hypothetical protein n=1 Tax=Pseudomonas lini TaxID=163011 RepID=UPI000A96F3F1|nr:hypothetical protein [Pseudomonas lini]